MCVAFVVVNHDSVGVGFVLEEPLPSYVWHDFCSGPDTHGELARVKVVFQVLDLRGEESFPYDPSECFPAADRSSVCASWAFCSTWS